MDADALYECVVSEFAEAHRVFTNTQSNASLLRAIVSASQMCISTLQEGGKLISCGNGGSHCDAMHFAEELTGRFRHTRPPYAAMAISDPAHMSCVANDFGFEHVFARYVEGIGRKGDTLLALSTSGQSMNILNALKQAQTIGMRTILLTSTKVRSMPEASVTIAVPHQGYADRIQEMHITILHILIHLIERANPKSL